MQQETERLWAIVELMGRKVLAGQVSQSDLLGAPLMRVDVPATKGCAAFTQFYGPGAIYCVTPVSEEVARRTAETCEASPLAVYSPELVTREEFEEAKRRWQAERERLRERLLPAGRVGPDPTEPGDADDEEEEEGG